MQDILEQLERKRAAERERQRLLDEATAEARQKAEDARKVWPWAPEVPGKVINCADGWTRIDYPTCYLSVPDSFLERFPVPALVAEKEGV